MVRFSIVIPTRNRAETLVSAIRTCLMQDFDDYEIIVSDNCSTPETKQAVDDCGSTRVRYVRSEKPLALVDSWEFAVSHAKGEFVTVVGDDDGLLPHALREGDRLLQELKAPVLRWEYAYYYWPGTLRGVPNLLDVPLNWGCELLDSKRVVYDAVHGITTECSLPHARLPMLYNSFVHADLIAEVKKRAGRLFRSLAPDNYSGFAIAHLVDRYVSVNCPLSISGTSAKSIGVASALFARPSAIAEEFFTLDAKARPRAAGEFPVICGCPTTGVFEAFRNARHDMRGDESTFALDRKRFIQTLFREIGLCGDVTAEKWEEIRQALEAWIVDDPELRSWLTSELAEARQAVSPIGRKDDPWWGLHGTHLRLDTSLFGVKDLMGAAELFEKLFRIKENPIRASFHSNSPGSPGLSGFIKSGVRQLTPPAVWQALRGMKNLVGRGHS